jgi:pimeloyl-ACP methyl ester carboxylesterase
MMSDLPPIPLPEGIRSRFVENNNGLRMHVLEAGEGRAPCLLLLHGFPELAFSWRKIMVPLAQAGFQVVAPDQRGYGRTTGWDPDYDVDLGSYRMTNLVTDAVGLVFALGHRTVRAVIGHDFGSPVAAYAALVRPDVFESVALMSAPFAGPPSLPIGQLSTRATADNVHRELAILPRPRKHYQWYYASREANDDMVHCAQGLHAFLRAYYHQKSADWPGNKPHRLKAWAASELAKLPTYYVMDLHETMAQTVAHEMPTAEQIATCGWLPDSELAVYAREFQRTGFQGGLQWYRCAIDRDSRLSSPFSRAARSTCLRCSSLVRATGGTISGRAPLRPCRPRHAGACWGAISWKERATGSNKSSPS